MIAFLEWGFVVPQILTLSPQPGWVLEPLLVTPVDFSGARRAFARGAGSPRVPCICHTLPLLCLPQATTEPSSPPWNTRCSPILTHLVFLPDFSAQGQPCPPLFPNLALTPQGSISTLRVASAGKARRGRQSDDWVKHCPLLGKQESSPSTEGPGGKEMGLSLIHI